MLKLILPSREIWDPISEVFMHTTDHTLLLEHSLVTVSKWESKWHKPFLGKDKKTTEETLDYICCMSQDEITADDLKLSLTDSAVKKINEYIDDSMTATWFSNTEKKASRRIITSELIYCWMIQLQIPVEFEHWHLNRLLTLIKVVNEENQPKKKMNMNDVYRRNTNLNAARKAAMNSRG